MRVCSFAFFCVFSSTASAQVAVAVTTPEGNPTHRDVASGVVDAVDDAWEMLQPQLDPIEVTLCKADATCLQALANRRLASHLLVVGVAGLGVRDYVVSLQLYDSTGKKLVDENNVEAAGAVPADDGRGLAEKLLLVPGVPKQPPKAQEEPEPPPQPPPSTLALTGMGLMGAGAVVGLGTAVVALAGSVDPAVARDRYLIDAGAIVATTAAVGLGVAGVACVIADKLEPAAAEEAPAP